jgi:hypothetical protein
LLFARSLRRALALAADARHAAQKLAAISVVGTEAGGHLTKTGFEDRKRRGNGIFMETHEIAKKRGIKLGDVLRFTRGVIPEYTANGRTFSMRHWLRDGCVLQ